MREVVIVGSARTPIGTFGGCFKDVGASALGIVAVKAALSRAGLSPDLVEELIFGCVLHAGLGQNVARQISVGADLRQEVPSCVINKVCGSGLKAVQLAEQAIRLGDADIVVAGGTENMSQAPYLLRQARWGARMGNTEMLDMLVHDGLTDDFHAYHMGTTAENIAEKFGITREAQDAFAAQSQQRAEAAISEGRFGAEIAAVEIPQRKGDPIVVSADEYPKKGVTAESLASLRPVFKKDGSVTAGNASGINDGAAALVIMSREKADSLGIKPLALVRSSATAGVDPAYMGTGPIPASVRALKKAGIDATSLDLVESNEAFAVQSLCVLEGLKLDPQKVNVNGGAIALGHPIGASGARVLVTLLHELARRNARLGLATLCVGGGQGIAMVVENLQ